MKTGDWILYEVPQDLREYFLPDDTGHIPALVSGITSGKANLWLFPNTPNVPPMIKMRAIEVGQILDQMDGDDRMVTAPDVLSHVDNQKRKKGR
jgi:hypothetical protein